ncbi:MAG: 1-deoxy-D-xylulose-5-phosphate synthase [Rickettsiales bacterium]|nr:1-deoxy-D-xylulose-5-phosphate synthase [Rickettsiales bacterium]
MLIKKINSPEDIKELSVDELLQLSKEIKEHIINNIAKLGGHLGASLGVIELTIALHYVLNAPDDQIIWDVGHQSHPHKILTGRKNLETLKQDGGLSGFTKRSESIFDPFGAGHSSTSISAALGIDVAKKLNKNNSLTVAVIGDGALTAGMAYEALNNTGTIPNRLIIVLNDNDMSISPTEGAMSNYLKKLKKRDKTYHHLKAKIESTLKSVPLGDNIQQLLSRIKHYSQDIFDISNIFEDLGIKYIGPTDGHNLDELIATIKDVQSHCYNNPTTPILLHVITEKGRGFYSPNGGQNENFHAVSKFCPNTYVQSINTATAPTYTQVFATSLINLAKDDPKIVAITAAMPSGTGLDQFKLKFPDRFFDVGIAEQHAATFAAGLACEGLKPFFTVYSTFLQRAYDQIIHDIAIQNLPVRLAIDRAGLVGADGATHAGSFDLAFLSILPNMVVMAPSSADELYEMTKFASLYNDGPISLRYPRGNAYSSEAKSPQVKIGKGLLINEGSDVAIISLGSKLNIALKAAEILKNNYKISATVIDARFAKPIDTDLINSLAKHHPLLLTLEEGSIGGFATQVNHYLLNNDLVKKCNIRNLMLPDEFIDHGSLEGMYKKACLDVDSIVSCITNFFKISNIETLQKHLA